MDIREARGLELANSKKITNDGALWVVPSQHGNGKYRVDLTGVNPSCSCADYELLNRPCTHIFAVLHMLQGERKPARPTAPAPRIRPTYAQKWTSYNLAQRNEKAHFLHLLHALCQGIEEPAQTFGRPRLPLADMVFGAALKTYVGF